MKFTLTVYGTPVPAGSKRAVTIGKGSATERVGVIDANKKAAPWKKEITQTAGRAMAAQGMEMLAGPLEARFTFFRARPKGHVGARGLKPSAPPYPTTKPDALKLARGVEDALTGVVYLDDSQIVTELLKKRYGTPERVEIEIVQVEDQLAI
jgi:Holliday junction resolvase RusA-like endonuclease